MRLRGAAANESEAAGAAGGADTHEAQETKEARLFEKTTWPLQIKRTTHSSSSNTETASVNQSIKITGAFSHVVAGDPVAELDEVRV